VSHNSGRVRVRARWLKTWKRLSCSSPSGSPGGRGPLTSRSLGSSRWAAAGDAFAMPVRKRSLVRSVPFAISPNAGGCSTVGLPSSMRLAKQCGTDDRASAERHRSTAGVRLRSYHNTRACQLRRHVLRRGCVPTLVDSDIRDKACTAHQFVAFHTNFFDDNVKRSATHS
jgi:hypothetical protein